VLEVNVAKPKIEKVKHAVLNFDPKQIKSKESSMRLESNLFDEVETSLLYNLTDMYTRFFKSGPFKNYLNSAKYKETMESIKLKNQQHLKSPSTQTQTVVATPSSPMQTTETSTPIPQPTTSPVSSPEVVVAPVESQSPLLQPQQHTAEVSSRNSSDTPSVVPIDAAQSGAATPQTPASYD